MIAPLLLMLAAADANIEATSSFLKVSDLLALCENDKEACVGYVEGASDMLKFLQATGSIPARYCTTPDVKLGMLTTEVVDFLRHNPAMSSQGAGGATWAVLTTSHPCAAPSK
jgi:hypothetical protein